MNALDALRERYALPDSVNRLAFSVDTFDANGFTTSSKLASRRQAYVSKREVSEADRELLVQYRIALLESTGSATGSACDTFDAMFTCNEHWENIVAGLKKN
jgi:hypothetical protein